MIPFVRWISSCGRRGGGCSRLYSSWDGEGEGDFWVEWFPEAVNIEEGMRGMVASQRRLCRNVSRRES